MAPRQARRKARLAPSDAGTLGHAPSSLGCSVHNRCLRTPFGTHHAIASRGAMRSRNAIETKGVGTDAVLEYVFRCGERVGREARSGGRFLGGTPIPSLHCARPYKRGGMGIDLGLAKQPAAVSDPCGQEGGRGTTMAVAAPPGGAGGDSSWRLPPGGAADAARGRGRPPPAAALSTIARRRQS